MGTLSIRIPNRLLPFAGILAVALALGAVSVAQERDKSSALAAKLREEAPLSRGEYEAAEAKRAAALDARLDALEKMLDRLGDRLTKIDAKLEKFDDRLAKIEKAVKP